MKKKLKWEWCTLWYCHNRNLFRAMKLTVFLSLFLVLQGVANSSFSQSNRLSVKMSNVALVKVLNYIESETEFSFLYNSKNVDVKQHISVSLENEKIDKVLDYILDGTGAKYRIIDRQIILMAADGRAAQSQKKIKISGKVTDEAGEPLPGVSVVIKGTTVGITSDIDGKYVLTVPADAKVLQFSFVGMKVQEVELTGQTNVDVTMIEDAIGLEEVVAVGYGFQKKADLTGAVSAVKGDAIVKDSPASLTHAIAGKVAGVITTFESGQPGRDNGTFSIRGKSTFGNNNALVLVDGVPRAWHRIDPSEIESFVILKDAASTAIYGARAANGVVLITTKRGKKGEAKLTYRAVLSTQKATIEPDLMNAYEYAKYFNEGKLNDGQNQEYTDEEVEKYRTGAPGYEGTNWWKETVKDSAPKKQHTLTVTGGTDKARYFVSGNFMDQKGLLPSTKFKRYGFRSNIDVNPIENLTVSADITYRREERAEAGKGDRLWGMISESNPTYKAYLNKEGVVENGLGFNGMNTNPIGEGLHTGYRRYQRDYYQTNFVGVYNVPGIEGLTLKGRLSYDKEFRNDAHFETPFILWTHDKVNDTYSSKPTTNKITLNRKKEELRTLNTMASVTYKRTFGEHNFNLLALVESSETKGNWIKGYREGFISDKIDKLFAGSSANQKTDGSAYETARLGYAGRMNYDYQGKYLFQANFRYDGSYNFSKDKRWGFFPAFSLGWRMSNENFIKDNFDWISNLKLRASYGKVGNDRVSAYQYLSGFQFSSGYLVDGTYEKGVTPTKLANPDITWETATDYNLGLDFGISNKISGTLEYFYKRTEDILRPRNASIPDTFGASLPDENSGVVDNKGFEASINYHDKSGEFSWDLNGTFTYARSKVIEIDEPENVPDRLRQTGRPFGQHYGYVALGLFQTQEEIDNWVVQDGNGNKSLRPGDIKYKDISGADGTPDGKIDGYDRTHIGKSKVPEIMFGFNASVSYKNFALTCNFQGAANFDKNIPLHSFVNRGNTMRRLIDSWRPGNEGAKYPRLGNGTPVNNDRTSSYWLLNSSYLRLKNLTVSYTFQKKEWLKKARISNLRVFATGTNLFTWSEIDFQDPEGPETARPFYPQMKVYSLGVNVEF
ncbi:SusC/RagA family TonB-linked outer membrane protein [Prolixibacteraceae bacterium JC049]|nr:SusC/RagA family TonB-linked outer membrane protein [Prolixibacteraceae bacterium JC049]